MPWNGLLDVVVFAAGFFLVVATLGSAIRTVVLPRAVPAKLASFVFVTMRKVFDLRLKRATSYERRDRVMAPYAPLSLFALATVWMFVVLSGYSLMFWALREGSYREDFRSSGSALLTLGFEQPDTIPTTILAFTEAAIGLTLLALLITYLPSLYSAFARREAEVALMEVRAGAPPSGVAMIERYARIGWIGGLSAIWERWERWFVEVEESHSSFPALVFFRSPQSDQSWVTAAGAVLDAAALVSSTLEERDPDANLCIRAGYVCLRRVATFFGIPYNPDPSPDDAISITRDEYDEAYERLAAAGLQLNADRDKAWRDFAGWRVNYDEVLLTLAALVMAPYAPWSSDRSITRHRVRVVRGRPR